MTYDDIVSELRALRLERDRADARLLLRLVEIENDHIDTILAAGCASFAQFLKQLGMIDVARYDTFKRGLSRVGAEEALAIGSDATIVAGQLTNGPEQYVDAIRASIEERGGTLPSRQTAKRILMQVDPRRETPRAMRKKEELAKLRAENATLKAENKQLRRKLRALERKMEKTTADAAA